MLTQPAVSRQMGGLERRSGGSALRCSTGAVGLGRLASRQQIDRIFAAELARLDEPARKRQRATLDALVGPDVWHLLRSSHGLPQHEARLAVREALYAQLPPPVPPGGGKIAPASTSTPGASADHSHPADDADRTEEVDQRIERLMAAIEAGTPADLVAPRLRELKAARGALEAYGPARGEPPVP